MRDAKNTAESDLSAILDEGHRVRAEILRELEASEAQDGASLAGVLLEGAKIVRLARTLEQVERREHVAMEKAWKRLLKMRRARAKRDRENALIAMIDDVISLKGPHFLRTFIVLRGQLLSSAPSERATRRQANDVGMST